MPAAVHLARRGAATSSTSPVAGLEDELELQSPLSALRQHLDAEALPRPDFFDSLDDLHLWYQMRSPDVLHDHLEPCSRNTGPPALRFAIEAKPRLVVCHDFQGGYTEDPHRQGYTLEHLQLIDTFIYFSHKRVSIPPAGWLSAAARTGTKVLGTLIFEWAESVPDLAQLLRGPERKAMPLRGAVSFSPQYAVELIDLALERGFSGYLVNIEVALDLGFSCSGEAWPAWVGQEARVGEVHKNAERLRAWVHFLREEGTRRFVQAGRPADEWHVMWYDSVVYPYGQLAWQDALNEHNIDFFQSAHSFFTNYTWARPPQPLPPGQLIDEADESPQTLQLRGYGLTGADDGGFHPQLLLSAAMADSVERARGEVYVGIDVFGRNCWGGLQASKSLDMIGPHRAGHAEELNLGVALFAPGWTWEEESAGRTLSAERASIQRRWQDWWHIDLAFWIGIPRPLVPNTYRITLEEGEVRPVQLYFGATNLEPARLERRASTRGFYTDFGFGSGERWFDRGEVVHEWPAGVGFTDMGVCMPKPDLLFSAWQQRQQRHSEAELAAVPLTWTFDHGRAWAGTASLVVALTPQIAETAAGLTTVPLCSAVVKLGGVKGEWIEWTYTLAVDGLDSTTPTDVIPAVTALGTDGAVEVVQDSIERTELENGWHAFSAVVRVRSNDDDAPVALGLGVSFRLEDEDTGTRLLRVGALELVRASAFPERAVGDLEVRAAVGAPGAAGEQSGRLQPSVLCWSPREGVDPAQFCNVWIQASGQPSTRVWLGTSTREATTSEFCLSGPFPLPAHLAPLSETLELSVTSLTIGRHTTVARGSAAPI